MSLPCYYALGGVNFKNGFVTSCPQQSDQLQILEHDYLPSKFFNNANFRKHRLDLLNGKWPKGCDICQHVEERRAGKSMRQEEPVTLEFVNKETGEVDFAGLKTAEIRFSHSCNMSCLHCSQVYSSGWMSKLKKYTPDNEDKEYKLLQLTGEMHRASPDDDLTMSISTERALEIVDDLNKHFPNLERVDFAGGEVLYQKQFFPTLERLTQHPNSKNMIIMFHSNFNAKFDPVKLSDLLIQFKRAIIHVSVDSGPTLYPYFRQGDWNKLKENIAAFRAVNKNKSELNLVCTTGTYQIMEIKDVFEGFLSLDCNFIDSSIIYTPTYLNPALMMQNFEKEVLQDIKETEDMIDRINKERLANIDESKKLHSFNIGTWTDIEGAYRALKHIKDYITNNVTAPKDWAAFKVYVRKTDQLWKQNFNDHITNYKFDGKEIVRINHV